MDNGGNGHVSAVECAKGAWQRGIMQDMCNNGAYNPLTALRGKASSYRGHYARSFASLLRRMRNAGYRIDIDPGTRGGLYSATYYAVFDSAYAGEPVAVTVQRCIERLALPVACVTYNDHDVTAYATGERDRDQWLAIARLRTALSGEPYSVRYDTWHDTTGHGARGYTCLHIERLAQ